VSGQLEGELGALALGEIYTFGPTFRAENSNTPRHLAEFWMIEPEMAFYDLKDTMDLAEDFLKYLIRYALDNCSDDLKFLNNMIDKNLLDRLNFVVSNEFVRLTYTEAIDILSSASKKWEFPVGWGRDLQAEHERYEAERERYDEISAMTKNERKNIGIDEKPKNPQFFQYLTKDFTPETLYDIHKINNRGLLIDREELKGYLDDFNRYNKSGEQSNMLSSWSRVSMVYNRKNAIIRIENPFINILGGMQPDVLPDLAKDGRAENGFVQRFCYAFPDNVDIQYYNKEKLPESVYREWENFINDLLKLPHTKLKLTDDAHQLYENWFNKNREIIYNEPSQHMKGAFGKLDIISLRLAIVIKGMKIIYEADYSENISGEIMQSAIDITEYFRATQKKVFARMFKPAATMTKRDAIRWVTENLPGKTQTEIAEFFNTSRSQIKRI